MYLIQTGHPRRLLKFCCLYPNMDVKHRWFYCCNAPKPTVYNECLLLLINLPLHQLYYIYLMPPSPEPSDLSRCKGAGKPILKNPFIKTAKFQELSAETKSTNKQLLENLN